MKKGFTLLELLVASLLLGMLMTILTMIFNQSSIAWRTGIAGVADLDDVRTKIATDREEADDIYMWNDRAYKIVSPWDSSGSLRDRAWTINGTSEQEDTVSRLGSKISSSGDVISQSSYLIEDDVGSASSGNSIPSYTVNVKSAGPNRKFDDYDDIWSMPDEFD